jgi:predicted GIY-YIG superfamily endonuclease
VSRRIHRIKFDLAWFSRRYNCSKLVYYEPFVIAEDALRREKQLKGGRREKKNELKCRTNPDWDELFHSGSFDSLRSLRMTEGKHIEKGWGCSGDS